jgi:hypothetical protein
MAITATPVLQSQNLFIADIVAGLDADTTLDVNHGLGITPLEYRLVPTAGAGANFAALCQWNITAPTATKVTVNKVAGVGTAASSAARLLVWRPHSIIR